MTAPPDIRARQPGRLLLGVDHLLRIRTHQLDFYADMQRRHGDAVRLRLGPYRSWLLFHPDLFEPVLTRHAPSFVRFRKLTKVLRQWNGHSLVMAEGSDWKDRRRKVLPAFQTRRLPAYGEAVVRETMALCARMAERAGKDGRLAFDADAVMARLTLNIAARTMFGAEPPATATK